MTIELCPRTTMYPIQGHDRARAHYTEYTTGSRDADVADCGAQRHSPQLILVVGKIR